MKPAKAMLVVNAWALECLRIWADLNADERVRLDVLAELDLGTAKETTDVGLNVSRRDVEHICSDRSCSLTCGLIGHDA
jgi:hypothetical protein